MLKPTSACHSKSCFKCTSTKQVAHRKPRQLVANVTLYTRTDGGDSPIRVVTHHASAVPRAYPLSQIVTGPPCDAALGPRHYHRSYSLIQELPMPVIWNIL